MTKITRLFLLLSCVVGFARSFVPPLRFLLNNRVRVTAASGVGPRPHELQSTPQQRDTVGDNDDDETEVLLRMNLGINTGADPDSSLEAVRRFARSFPFAAVLPVQPLTYIPSEDGRGVKVTFLRKKTKEKGSVDGGIDISVDFTTSTKDNDDPDNPLIVSSGGKRIRLLATRNPEGQTLNKIFSEKIIVLAFVKSIAGEDLDGANKELSSMVSVESIFHKWLA
eukprot:CAMPEP_0168184576 /NCGR_PEP_ID=MMETSP0139_2-20121125/13320_1 /TAXON_ID=44445 /ORGANISM="Pseudo-nitzschia australis, Strain 10249 10 AB" /LENGTH=223 /DNA_ID=CAMNT_0008106221 /DNA_START=169 /DNA_END=840 /DNA_ORIENTATION=+